jgi:hypothetical protein
MKQIYALARRLAQRVVDGQAVELWQADRFIERYEPGSEHNCP